MKSQEVTNENTRYSKFRKITVIVFLVLKIVSVFVYRLHCCLSCYRDVIVKMEVSGENRV